MIKNQKQIDAFNDQSRYKFLLCGRQSGKTTLIKWDIAKAVTEMPPNTDIFYIGPSNQHAYDLMWEALEDLFSYLGWKYQTHQTSQVFFLPNRRKVYITGAEKIRKIRGHRVYKVYMDEVAFFEKDLEDIWRAVSPSLSTTNGKAIFSTTPDGTGSQAYNFYMNNKHKKDWSFHTWFSTDNPAISKQEIEDARQNLDEASFKQEYEASWQSYGELAYYNFDEKIHVKKQEPIDYNSPVIMHFDFNVNPTTLVLGQRDSDMYRLKKEYSLLNSSTSKTVETFCEDFKLHKSHMILKIRGDATGNARKSNTGYADYHYIKEILTNNGFQFKYEVPSVNPSIIDRVQHVNNYLMNANKKHRLEIDPSCVDTIKDLGGQKLEGRFPSDKGNLGHKMDSVGYGIWWDWATTNGARSSSIQL